MKMILLASVLAAGAAGVGGALQEDDRAPVNKTCPVMKGKPIKREFMAVYEGRPIGFCCGKCKKLWDEDPSEYAANLPSDGPPPPKPPDFAILGKPVPDPELKVTDGTTVKLSDFKDQVIILQWTDPMCPISGRIAEAGITADILKRIRPLAPNAFHFSICSAAGAKPEVLATFLSERNVDSRGLMDSDGKAARAFGAKTSSHVFVIDGQGLLRYSGAVDNDPEGKKAEKGEKVVNYVVAAIEAIAAGKKVTPEKTAPYGSALKAGNKK